MEYAVQEPPQDAQYIGEYLSQELRRIQAAITPEDWIVPTLLNGWGEFDPSTHVLSYLRDPNGFVHLRGFSAGGTITNNTTVFTLPEGYRPRMLQTFGGWTFGDTPTRYWIYPTGNVALRNTGVNPPSSIWISFDGITFMAEQ